MAVMTPFFDIVAGVAILAGRSSLLDTKVFKTGGSNFTLRHLLGLGFVGYGGWHLWKVERAQDKLKESLEAESFSEDEQIGGFLIDPHTAVMIHLTGLTSAPIGIDEYGTQLRRLDDKSQKELMNRIMKRAKKRRSKRGQEEAEQMMKILRDTDFTFLASYGFDAESFSAEDLSARKEAVRLLRKAYWLLDAMDVYSVADGDTSWDKKQRLDYADEVQEFKETCREAYAITSRLYGDEPDQVMLKDGSIDDSELARLIDGIRDDDFDADSFAADRECEDCGISGLMRDTIYCDDCWEKRQNFGAEINVSMADGLWYNLVYSSRMGFIDLHQGEMNLPLMIRMGAATMPENIQELGALIGESTNDTGRLLANYAEHNGWITPSMRSNICELGAESFGAETMHKLDKIERPTCDEDENVNLIALEWEDYSDALTVKEYLDAGRIQDAVKVHERLDTASRDKILDYIDPQYWQQFGYMVQIDDPQEYTNLQSRYAKRAESFGAELEQGEAAMRIVLADGELLIYHDSNNELLFRRPIYEGEWDKLWAHLRGATFNFGAESLKEGNRLNLCDSCKQPSKHNLNPVYGTPYSICYSCLDQPGHPNYERTAKYHHPNYCPCCDKQINWDNVKIGDEVQGREVGYICGGCNLPYMHDLMSDEGTNWPVCRCLPCDCGNLITDFENDYHVIDNEFEVCGRCYQEYPADRRVEDKER